MCENFPNIRITEGNAFALLLPLRTRTYVSSQPIDKDIDYTLLNNIVFTFGGVEYAAEVTESGVKIILPDTLAVGTYNAILTAEYLGNDIRAAYESAVTIVPWSDQSTAEQYIAGSPIVMRAAYVLSGAMTDAELEQLKEEYREKNSQLQQAIADAEAAKAEWEQKAADLDGLAQESTLEAVSDKIGTPLQGQPTDLFAAIAQGGSGGVGGIPVVQMTETTATIAPNKLYIWDEVASLDLTLETPTYPSIVNEYMCMFGSGSVLPTLTLPAAVEVRGEMDYNRVMCLSIINNIAYLA